MSHHRISHNEALTGHVTPTGLLRPLRDFSAPRLRQEYDELGRELVQAMRARDTDRMRSLVAQRNRIQEELKGRTHP